MSEIKTQCLPELRFQEFEGESINYLFKDVFQFSTGKNIKQKEASPEFEIPCVRYGELYHMYNEVIYEVINKTNLDKSELRFSQGNEILLPSAGEDPLDIGSASALTVKNVAIGRTINILTPLVDDVYSQIYVSYYINEKLRIKISTLAKGSSISNVYNSDLKTLKINLPSLPEQQKIASFLTAVDKKIQLLNKKKDLLEAYKKGVMQQLFSGELRFKPNVFARDEANSSNKTEYPEWEEKRMGEIGKVVSGLTYSPDDKSEDGVLVLRSSNVHGRRVTYDDNVYVNVGDGAYNSLKENDILICVRNGSKRLIGKNALITGKAIGVAFGAFMSVYRSENNLYIFHFFDTDGYKKEVHKNLGATINSINGSDLKKFKIPFPCLEEQEKIAAYLSAIDRKIAAVTSARSATEKFKKGLLQKMFV